MGIDRLRNAETILALSRILGDLTRRDILTHLAVTWGSVNSWTSSVPKSGWSGDAKKAMLALSTEPIVTTTLSREVTVAMLSMIDSRIGSIETAISKAAKKPNVVQLKEALKSAQDTRKMAVKEPAKVFVMMNGPERSVVQLRAESLDKNDRPRWMIGVRDSHVASNKGETDEAIVDYHRVDLQQKLSELLNKYRAMWPTYGDSNNLYLTVTNADALALQLAELERTSKLYFAKMPKEQYEQLRITVETLRKNSPQEAVDHNTVQDELKNDLKEAEVDDTPKAAGSEKAAGQAEKGQKFAKGTEKTTARQPEGPRALDNGLALPAAGSADEALLIIAYRDILEKRSAKAGDALQNARKASMLETARRHLAFIEKTERDLGELQRSPREFLGKISKFDVLRLQAGVEIARAAETAKEAGGAGVKEGVEEVSAGQAEGGKTDAVGGVNAPATADGGDAMRRARAVDDVVFKIDERVPKAPEGQDARPMLRLLSPAAEVRGVALGEESRRDSERRLTSKQGTTGAEPSGEAASAKLVDKEADADVAQASEQEQATRAAEESASATTTPGSVETDTDADGAPSQNMTVEETTTAEDAETTEASPAPEQDQGVQEDVRNDTQANDTTEQLTTPPEAVEEQASADTVDEDTPAEAAGGSSAEVLPDGTAAGPSEEARHAEDPAEESSEQLTEEQRPEEQDGQFVVETQAGVEEQSTQEQQAQVEELSPEEQPQVEEQSSEEQSSQVEEQSPEEQPSPTEEEQSPEEQPTVEQQQPTEEQQTAQDEQPTEEKPSKDEEGQPKEEEHQQPKKKSWFGWF
jgi:hypothetical protein